MTGRFIKRNRNTPIRRKMKKEGKKICKFRRKSLYNFTILENSSIQDFMRLKDIDICEASFKNKVNSNNKS